MATRRDISTEKRDRQIAKFARAAASVLQRLGGKDPYDPRALAVLVEIANMFSQNGNINLQSIDREVRSRFANVEQQVRSWRRLREMYLGVQYERLLVSNFKAFLNDEHVAQTLLVGVFATRRLDVILSKSKDYILGECNAKPGFATTMEDLEMIEDVLRARFGFHFGMTEDQIRVVCDSRVALCNDKIETLTRGDDD